MSGYVLNGQLQLGDVLAVEFHQPYFAHGYGLFETMRAVAGKPAFFDEHFERLTRSALVLQHGLPYSRDEALNQVRDLIAALGQADLRLKIHLLVKHVGVEFLVTAQVIEPFAELAPALSMGLAARNYSTMLALPQHKTMNYMVNMLAFDEAQVRGFGEALFCSADDVVYEGSKSSLFFAKDGVLCTPSLDLPILPGITRSVVIGLAKKMAIRLSKADLVEGS